MSEEVTGRIIEGEVSTKYKLEIRPNVDYRHAGCGRLLFRGFLSVGSTILIRCPKCGRMAVINAPELDQAVIDKA